MKKGTDHMEVVRYLVDVQDEYSPERFGLYLASVRSHMPKAAYAELEAAMNEIAAAGLHIDGALREVKGLPSGPACPAEHAQVP